MPDSLAQIIYDEWIDTPEGLREFRKWARRRNGFTEQEMVEWIATNPKLKAYHFRRVAEEVEKMKRAGMLEEVGHGKFRLPGQEWTQ